MSTLSVNWSYFFVFCLLFCLISQFKTQAWKTGAILNPLKTSNKQAEFYSQIRSLSKEEIQLSIAKPLREWYFPHSEFCVGSREETGTRAFRAGLSGDQWRSRNPRSEVPLLFVLPHLSTRCHWEKNLLFLSLQHLLVAKQIPWVTMWAQNLCRTARNLLHPIVKVKNEIIPLTCHYFAQSFHYWMVMAQNVILTYLWEYKWVLHILPPREWEGRKGVLGSLRLILLWVNDCGEAGGTNQQCPLPLEKWCFRQVKTILI